MQEHIDGHCTVDIDGFTCYKSHLHSQDSHVTQLSLIVPTKSHILGQESHVTHLSLTATQVSQHEINGDRVSH